MELEGEKTTHDFLSLCSKEPAPPKQGLFLKTHDFLQPLEAKKSKKASGEADVVDHSTEVEHVLPGGIGTYTISHVPVVKPEWPVDVAVTQGGHVSSHSSSYSRGGGFTLWEEPRPSVDRVVSGSAAQHWPASSPYASHISNSSTSFGSLLSTRTRTRQDKGRSMDVTSRSGKAGLTDDDEEDCGRQEGSSCKDLATKVDAKRNGDQKPTTPRSKHSATEQRRRSKINDRFQILRDLIPRSDQKRDKASFLLEVIEYIQFLQEKSQKYESGYPGWSHDNTKLPSWKINQMPTTATDASHVVQNGPSASDFVFSSNSAVPVAPAALANDHIMEYENVNSRLTSKVASSSAPLPLYVGSSGFAQPQLRLVADLENAASGSQAQQPRQPGRCGDMLKDQDLTIDEGTINISSAYSQGLLHILGETLQKSGMDLSQASISVQINLGKRAFSKLASSHKDHDDPSSGNQGIAHSQMDSTAVESQQPNKRHKTR